MTSLRQVSGALRPLLERHPDLALVGRWLFVRPIRHVVRGLVVDGTSRTDVFRPTWAVMHLFEVHSSIFLNWGEALFPPYQGLWKWSEPQALTALQHVMEHDVLPKLRSIESIDDLMLHLSAYYRQHGIVDKPPLYDWPHVKLIFDVAMGNLDAARKPCTEWVPTLRGETYFRGDADDHAAAERLAELCRRCRAGDRGEMAALLHEWEATTVRNLKIEHLWEPTPFPLELGPSQT